MVRLNFVSTKNNLNWIMVKDINVSKTLNDKWIKIKPNSIVSYKNILLKLTLSDEQNYYLLVDNLFLKYDQDQATIHYDVYLNSFIQKKDKKYLAQIKEKYAAIKKEILSNKTAKMFNWTNVDETKYELLKRDEFYLKTQIYYSLIKKELPWN
ncbi:MULTISPECIES: MSC_0621 family F1-like ATPase epsilon subunit [unclassified Mycoplasma]|uniref:MSC_0621 family F1-like ATPase epsilon subunit n=1 Tax=unclassified Mycoplasma TaxID=2683645 RepID=UPI00211B9FA9|nr:MULTISPECIES: hypothetical protein [unclassified Mycoplasma]UUM19663.1 hypothetical protein NPA11_02745 [Mycoplasma sp. 1578d]UUM24632.1 hypothetical protein NPA12_02970 [Mycoplasma sp. 3686d]